MGVHLGGRGRDSSRRKRRPARIERGQAQKPFRPIENPFPSKGEFRLGVYQIVEEKDDYLVCRGFDPRAKNPFAKVTPSAPRTIKVAKPPLLTRTPWDGRSVEINGITYSYEYDSAYERTVTWTEDEEEQEEEQQIEIPYFEDDIIVAIEVRQNLVQDVIEVNEEKIRSEEGGLLSWIDLNVSGRHWASTSSDIRVFKTKPQSTHTDGSSQTHDIYDTGGSDSSSVRTEEPTTVTSYNKTGEDIETDQFCSTFKPFGSQTYYSFPWTCPE
jgi:hypothetical protein